MDFESVKLCWRGEASTPRLEEKPVMLIVNHRAGDLRRELRRRLRREAGYYLPILAVTTASLVSGFTLNRVLATGGVGLMLGGIIVTLWRAERSIEDTPLDRSLRDALVDLALKVDAAGRAYVAAYVTVFVVAAVALVAHVLWRYGAGGLFGGALVLGAGAVMWARRSGRGYVERMFRRYRVDLAECLHELDELG